MHSGPGTRAVEEPGPPVCLTEGAGAGIAISTDVTAPRAATVDVWTVGGAGWPDRDCSTRGIWVRRFPEGDGPVSFTKNALYRGCTFLTG